MGSAVWGDSRTGGSVLGKLGCRLQRGAEASSGPTELTHRPSAHSWTSFPPEKCHEQPAATSSPMSGSWPNSGGKTVKVIWDSKAQGSQKGRGEVGTGRN